MGKEVRFLNSVKNLDGTYNVTYGVDDFNKITSCLIGSGVAPFPSKDTYIADELNAMTEAVVSSGASLDGLKVSFADGVISVSQGIAFFSNGATIEVDSEGVTLDYTAADTVYVYAAYDSSLNICDIYASDKAPVETDVYFVVNLAEISIEGIVSDKRVFARSKVGTLGRNVTREVSVLTTEDTAGTAGGWISYYEGSVIFEFDFDISRFNAIYFLGEADDEIKSFIKIQDVLNVSEGEHTGYNGDDGIQVYHRSSGGYSYSDSLYLRYKDGKLQLYVPVHEGYQYWDWHLDLRLLTATFV